MRRASRGARRWRLGRAWVLWAWVATLPLAASAADNAATAAPPPPKPAEAELLGPPLPKLAADLALAEAATQTLGRPVVAVEVVAPAGEDARALAQLVDVQPGFLLDAQQVQSAIERLYALGRFAQVEARVEPVGCAVVLRFVVTPMVRLDEIYVKGLKRMDPDALHRALAVAVGDEVDGQTEALLRGRALAHAAHVGFPRAEVRVAMVPGAQPATVAIRVHVVEGPADEVMAVHVTGRRLVAEAYLLPALQVRPGHVLDLQALERDRQALEARYAERGFLRAEVKLLPPTYNKAAPGGPRRAQINFEVEAHERLTFAFAGNRLFAAEALQSLWPGKVGGSPRASLGLYAQRIRAHYARESYPNVRVKVGLHDPEARRPGARKMNHTCEVVVYVDEGAPVWVSGVAIEGAGNFPNDILRRQIRAVLARELTESSFFTPLGPAAQAQSQPPQFGVDWAPHRIPAEQRWVPELYARAADDIAAAYQAVGFVDVQVAVPDYQELQDQGRDRGAAPAHLPLNEASRRTDVDAAEPFVRPGFPPPLPPVAAIAHVHVTEGPQHFIASITFRGNAQVQSRALLAAMEAATVRSELGAPIAPGAPLSLEGIEDARIAIVRHYREQGFVYVRAFCEVVPQKDRASADVTFTVEEGPQVRVEHVLIRGNRFTREGVIRSRISLKPGAIYRLDKAIADQQEVMALGTFNRARVKLVDEEHPSDTKDVVAEVEERFRQPVEVVPGLSTASGPRLRLTYGHINVAGTASTFVASLKVNRQLFFGLYGPYANTLRERYQAYRGLEQLTRAVEREVRLGLRSPRIKALPFDPLLRLDLVDQRVNAVRYGLDTTTATLGVDTDPTPNLRISMEVQGGLTELECPAGQNCDQDRDIRRLRGGRPIQKGRRHTIKFGPIVRYDRRNDPISPSRGFVLQGRLSQAFGAARPDHVSVPFTFTKVEASATTYVPAFGAVFATSLRMGGIQLQRSVAPVDERFFLGGRDSLRGFVESTLIAQDACVVDDPNGPLPAHCVEPIASESKPPLSLGGNSFLLLKNEVRLPLGDNVSFDLFVDVGNLWVDLPHSQGFHLRVGTGVGLRYATPVGAMTLDFGVNPARRLVNQEPSWQVHFSIGSF